MAVSASDPIFTVEDVKVDVTAENAIAAREKAFEEAQIKAFQELTMRMLPDTDLATAPTPPAQTISTMIKDFELTNEQLSSVRYIGTYTFRFKDRDVRRYFARSGNTFTDVSSQTLLVLPFLKKDTGTILWTPGNIWMQAWNRVPSLQGLVPLEVPIGDIADVKDISDSEALSYDPRGLNALLQRYNSGEAVIAITTPDAQLSQITNPQETARGRLIVEIYRTDQRAPELVQQISVIADGALTRDQMYDRAVTLTRSALQKDWKTRTSLPVQPVLSAIRLIVPIESLNDWIAIKKDLDRMTSLRSVSLKSLTPTQANIEIAYQGDQERLALTLAQAGLEIVRSTANDGSTVNVLQSSRYQPMRL